jgi:hypothetical protein
MLGGVSRIAATRATTRQEQGLSTGDATDTTVIARSVATKQSLA